MNSEDQIELNTKNLEKIDAINFALTEFNDEVQTLIDSDNLYHLLISKRINIIIRYISCIVSVWHPQILVASCLDPPLPLEINCLSKYILLIYNCKSHPQMAKYYKSNVNIHSTLLSKDNQDKDEQLHIDPNFGSSCLL